MIYLHTSTDVESFNRTTVECKFERVNTYNDITSGFNRTTVECKFC